MEFALPIDPHPYDPNRAKQLLAEAGTRTASTAATSRPTSPATWALSGSRSGSGRWSAPPSCRPGERRSSAASCWARRAQAGTRPPAWRGSRRGAGGTLTGGGAGLTLIPSYPYSGLRGHPAQATLSRVPRRSCGAVTPRRRRRQEYFRP